MKPAPLLNFLKVLLLVTSSVAQDFGLSPSSIYHYTFISPRRATNQEFGLSKGFSLNFDDVASLHDGADCLRDMTAISMAAKAGADWAQRCNFQEKIFFLIGHTFLLVFRSRRRWHEIERFNEWQFALPRRFRRMSFDRGAHDRKHYNRPEILQCRFDRHQ